MKLKINKMRHKTHFSALPSITIKVFKFNSQHVIISVRKHIDVFISKPEFCFWVTKAMFVIIPLSVESLTRFTKVISSLNYLKSCNSNLLVISIKWFNIVYKFKRHLASTTITTTERIVFPYSPSSSSNVHITIHLEEPVSCATDFEVIGATLFHSPVTEITA